MDLATLYGRCNGVAGHFWEKVAVGSADECWLWLGGTSEGYGHCSIGGRTVRAHRVAFALAYGPIRGGLLICHRCDVPLCCNPNHLFEGTNRENVEDMVGKGRHMAGRARGERHGSAKLTAAQVREIRARCGKDGLSMTELGKEFGVARTTIRRVMTGVNWAGTD